MKARRTSVGAALLAFVAGMLGCTSHPPALGPAPFVTNPCVPYSVGACTCDGGAQGVQSCGADGTYAACDCSPMEGGIIPTDVTAATDIVAADAVPADGTVSCTSTMSTCGLDGRCLDLLTDLNNCGACGNVCALNNVVDNGCSLGRCAVIACAPNFGDCDGIAANGCETRLGTNTNCASCSDDCATQGETCCAGCAGGSRCH